MGSRCPHQATTKDLTPFWCSQHYKLDVPEWKSRQGLAIGIVIPLLTGLNHLLSDYQHTSTGPTSQCCIWYRELQIPAVDISQCIWSLWLKLLGDFVVVADGYPFLPILILLHDDTLHKHEEPNLSYWRFYQLVGWPFPGFLICVGYMHRFFTAPLLYHNSPSGQPSMCGESSESILYMVSLCLFKWVGGFLEFVPQKR